MCKKCEREDKKCKKCKKNFCPKCGKGCECEMKKDVEWN